MLYEVLLAMTGVQTYNFSGDYTDSCKSTYITNTTTTATCTYMYFNIMLLKLLNWRQVMDWKYYEDKFWVRAKL